MEGVSTNLFDGELGHGLLSCCSKRLSVTWLLGTGSDVSSTSTYQPQRPPAAYLRSFKSGERSGQPRDRAGGGSGC